MDKGKSVSNRLAHTSHQENHRYCVPTRQRLEGTGEEEAWRPAEPRASSLASTIPFFLSFPLSFSDMGFYCGAVALAGLELTEFHLPLPLDAGIEGACHLAFQKEEIMLKQSEGLEEGHTDKGAAWVT